MAGYGAAEDDTARFLRELRQLRDGAGLSQAELAARAHYPYEVIRAAEVGPALPDLPVLSAYVRGCGETTEEWEERWRSLTRTPSLPVSAARQSGLSDAATAGARINSTTQVGDGPDPSIIIAALNRVAEEMASPGADAVPASPDLPSRSGFGSPDSPASPGVPGLPPGFEPDDKPAGWDPIRVSSAWPVLGYTPAVAGDTGSQETAAPWDAAPWADDSAALAGRAASGAAAASGARASGGAPHPAHGPVRSPSWTRTVLLVVAALCVLGVLLAIFA